MALASTSSSSVSGKPRLRTTKSLEVVHSAMRQRVLTGEWKPGDKIPTEAELASEFGCSLTTISKAMSLLAHEGFVERKQRVGTRILAVSPNSKGARGTRAAKGVSLDAYAFICPSEDHEGIALTVKGFRAAAREARRHVLMLTAGLDYRKEAEFIGRLSEFDVRGAVVYPLLPTAQDQAHFTQMMAETKFRFVLAEVGAPGVPAPSVVIDGFHAGYVSTRYLLSQGLTKIGFISNYARLNTMRDRYQGYRWALQEAGLREAPEAVMLERDMSPNFEDPFAEPEGLGERLLARSSALEGVVCADDFLAIGLIRSATKRGRKIGRDFKVVGMGDYTFSATSDIPLTTYHLPHIELGRTCFQVLDDILQNSILNTDTEHMVQGWMTYRDSA